MGTQPLRNRIADAAFDPQNVYSEKALRPVRYYEEDRDKWDGNPRWLGDGWLWQKTEIPEDMSIIIFIHYILLHYVTMSCYTIPTIQYGILLYYLFLVLGLYYTTLLYSHII